MNIPDNVLRQKLQNGSWSTQHAIAGLGCAAQYNRYRMGRQYDDCANSFGGRRAFRVDGAQTKEKQV